MRLSSQEFEADVSYLQAPCRLYLLPTRPRVVPGCRPAPGRRIQAVPQTPRCWLVRQRPKCHAGIQCCSARIASAAAVAPIAGASIMKESVGAARGSWSVRPTAMQW